MTMTYDRLLVQEQPGILRFGGARMALLDIEAGFWALRRQLEALVGPRLAAYVLQQAGAHGGASFARAFASEEAIGNGARSLRDCIAAYQAAGFGQFEVVESEWPLGRVLIRAQHAFEAWTERQHGGQTGAPVCAYTAGVLVGFVNVLDGRQDAVCIEHACQAEGAEACLFELLVAESAGDAPVVAFAPDPTHLVGSHTDISGRRLDEDALPYRAAFENLVSSISTEFINMPLDQIDLGINQALETIGEFTGVDRSYVFRFSGDRAWMGCTHEWCAPGIEPQINRMKDVPVARFSWSNRQLLRGESLHVPRLADLPLEAEAERREVHWQGTQSLVAVPLVYRGSTIGFVGFDSVREEKIWSDDSIQLLRLVAAVFANALEHRRAQAIQEGQRQFLELLATGGEFSETLHTLVRIIEEQWPGMLGLVLLLDEDGRHLHIGAAVSLPEAYVESIEGLEIGPRVGSCGTASFLGQRVIVEDIATDPRWDGLRDLAEIHGLRACWSEPVFSPEGVVVGTFAMYYRHARAPTEAELQTIETAAHLVGVAVQHKRAQEALHEAQRSLERRVKERTRELATLLQVSHDVNSTLELQPLLDLILDQLRTVVEYTGASILILEDSGLVVQAYRGPIPREEAGHLRFSLEDAQVNRQVIERREPIFIPDVRGDTMPARMFQQTAGGELESTFGYVRSWLGVPLMLKGEVLGMLTLDHSQPGHFTDQHADLVLTFANQVAVALENARLYAHAEESAVAAERNRLARDLHDAVTQTLFSASLIAEVLPRLWERDPEEARRRLQELRELTRGALAEMRTLLLELRPSALVEAQMGELLRQLGESITGRARVPVSVEIEEECRLDAEIKVALYRIAQEALNNVAKHAGATHAQVALRCLPASSEGEGAGVTVELCIRDDGLGFDPATLPPDSLGLGIMRERAEAIGAALTMESQPGAGTQIEVVWRSRVE